MSHKDYVLLASALADSRKELDMTNGRETLAWSVIASNVAHALRGTNPRFDWNRFMAAARGEPLNGRDRPRRAS